MHEARSRNRKIKYNGLFLCVNAKVNKGQPFVQLGEIPNFVRLQSTKESSMKGGQVASVLCF